MKTLLFGLTLLVTSFGVFLHASEAKPLPTVVIMLGPPGSGKGTQAVRIAKELQIPHISTGDLFRENISKNTALGQEAKGYMNAGKLVPDEVVLNMLFDRVSRPDCVNGFLLDGFPRTIPQAEALEKKLGQRFKVVALNLNVDDDVIFKRAEGRLTCKECSHVHNRYFSPSQEEGKCDQCGGELIQRPDDKAEVVQERLRVYHAQTEPLIEFYQSRNVLTHVNGQNAPDQVFEDLMKALNSSSSK